MVCLSLNLIRIQPPHRLRTGVSTLELPAAHILSALIWALGDVASVSAYFVASANPRREIIDRNRKPTGKFGEWPHEELIAVSGVLASGATVTFHVRGGIPKDKGGLVPFEWLVDGTEGSVEVRADSAWINFNEPQTVLFKGEPSKPEREGSAGLAGRMESGWREFAKGDEGEYATFEDGYRLHKLVEAIRRSAREGIRVTID